MEKLLSLEKNSISKIVGKLKSIISGRSINPIYDHLLFNIQDKNLVIKATDGNMAYIFTKSTETDMGKFLFTLDGNLFSNLLPSLDKDILSFDFNNSKDIKLTNGDFEMTFTSADIAEYPNIDVPDDLNRYDLPESFNNHIKNLYICISTDEGRVDLNSICFDINKEELLIIATDTIRLSSIKVCSNIEHTGKILIPRTSFSEIIKLNPQYMLYSSDFEKIYFVHENECGKYILKPALRSYKYPEVSHLIKNNFEDYKTISLKRLEFIKFLKRLKVTSDKSMINIVIENQKLMANTVNNKIGSKDMIPINSDMSCNFSVNVNFLLEYLNQDSEDICNFKVIANSKGNNCLVFDQDNFRHLVSVGA